MILFGHVCARPLSKNALVSSIDCLKINLKVRNMSSKVILPQNVMFHVLFLLKCYVWVQRRAARARRTKPPE